MGCHRNSPARCRSVYRMDLRFRSILLPTHLRLSYRPETSEAWNPDHQSYQRTSYQWFRLRSELRSRCRISVPELPGLLLRLLTGNSHLLLQYGHGTLRSYGRLHRSQCLSALLLHLLCPLPRQRQHIFFHLPRSIPRYRRRLYCRHHSSRVPASDRSGRYQRCRIRHFQIPAGS